MLLTQLYICTSDTTRPAVSLYVPKATLQGRSTKAPAIDVCQRTTETLQRAVDEEERLEYHGAWPGKSS
jgi:hypothetical protein